jgi:hypothetical protein
MKRWLCFNLNKLLGSLTPARGEDLPPLTLSRADENSVLPNPGARMKEGKQAGMWPGGILNKIGVFSRLK